MVFDGCNIGEFYGIPQFHIFVFIYNRNYNICEQEKIILDYSKRIILLSE